MSEAGGYEFSAQENKTIGMTASRARTWGIVSIIVGIFMALGGVSQLGHGFMAAIKLADGVVSIVVGIVFVGVGGSLKSVVDTQGNDIGLMMSALQKLGTAFIVQLIAVTVGFVAGLAIGVSQVH